ncbi:MAG: autotransporter-associated beta strand repeat-containing protein [Planctomycetia bacterium]|nr:autotransporter-associated beta strand repeat-containing protein [Planctomycetia bacterium]
MAWSLLMVLCVGGLCAPAVRAQETISVNFGVDQGSTSTVAGTEYGVVSTDGAYWNNFSGKSGSYTTLTGSSGYSYAISGTWSSANTWHSTGSTPPDTAPNARLLHGYLDDGGSQAHFAITEGGNVFFSYDLYHLASTDSANFRHVNVNGASYYGANGQTLQGTSSWGDGNSVRSTNGAEITFAEGTNYLRITDLTGATLSVDGQAKSNNTRGTFAALQIVNTADSLSRLGLSGAQNWSDAVWTNDLTSATNQAWTNGKLVRLFTSADTTMDLGGAEVAVERLMFNGTNNLSLTNGRISFTKKETIASVVQHATDGVLDLGNFHYLGDRSVYKFTTEKATGHAEGVVAGGYFGDAFASVQADGSIAAATHSETMAEGADYLNKGRVNVGDITTFNSLVTAADLLIDSGKTVTLTTGMLALQTYNHWIQGGGNITSGYMNSSGEYEIFAAAFGSVADMQTAEIGFLDNNGTTTNFIKSGSGNFQMRNNVSTVDGVSEYTGKTVVLEGNLYILGSNTASKTSGILVSKGAGLYISTARADGTTNYGSVTLSTGGICGEGSVTIGRANTDGNVTLTGDKGNFEHDGSQLASLHFQGNSLTLEGTAFLNVATLTTTGKTITVKGNAKLQLDSFQSTGGTTLNVQDNAQIDVSGNLRLDEASGSYTPQVVQTGGIVNVGGDLAIGHWSGHTAYYTISAGELNVLNYGSSGQSGLWMAVSSDGTLALSGTGTINSARLNLNARDARQTGTLTVTGGTLNVGSGGIMTTVSGTDRYAINLEGGTITSGKIIEGSANFVENGSWSSSLNATLTNAASPIVFQTIGDSTITWSGLLSGVGGLTKTGTGTLILAGNNTYSGPTNVAEGTLEMADANLGGALSIANGATLFASGSVGLDSLDISGNFVVTPGETQYTLTNGAVVSSDAVFDIAEGYEADWGVYDILVAGGLIEQDPAWTSSDWESLLAEDLRYTWNLFLSADGHILTLATDYNAIPEPGSWALMLLGLLALAGVRGRLKRA